jgi:hypothetical protein
MPLDTEMMPCPVCEAPAAEEPPHVIDATIIVCPNCERYKIADNMIPQIMMLEPQQRQAILDDAKGRAGPGELPYVSPQ